MLDELELEDELHGVNCQFPLQFHSGPIELVRLELDELQSAQDLTEGPFAVHLKSPSLVLLLEMDELELELQLSGYNTHGVSMKTDEEELDIGLLHFGVKRSQFRFQPPLITAIPKFTFPAGKVISCDMVFHVCHPPVLGMVI